MRSPVLRFRRLARRDRGVSYSLSFVLVVPLYLTVMLFAVEAGLLLITRVGVQYAAHMTARSAVVWQSAECSPAEREQMLRLKAAQSIAPYLGGRQREAAAAGPVPPEAAAFAADFADGVRRYQEPAAAAEPGLRRPYTRTRTPPDAEFLTRKFVSAWGRTTVELTPPAAAPDRPHGPLSVTVRLRAPLYLPVVSRFLDPDLQAPFEYPLEASATLPNDAPLSKDGTLGIPYRPYRPTSR